MKPINIYALTRIRNNNSLKKLERQLSERRTFISVKEWEVECIAELLDRLSEISRNVINMKFYYSFQIPKLGKEFDLLRISEDKVINIELKSFEVGDESIKKQLKLNRYYLALLGKNIRSYTFISSQNRLVRLTNSDNLIEAEWEDLYKDLDSQKNCSEADIESFFKEEDYLISPLTDPDRFLRGDYFLTSQQRDIKRQIMKDVVSSGKGFFGFTGLPGTGKTLLLYDLAMLLSERQKVCVLHYGSYPKELLRLDGILKRITFYCMLRQKEFPDLREYSAILIDEGHRMTETDIEMVKSQAVRSNVPVIVSYDREDVLADSEYNAGLVEQLRALPDFRGFALTNRIRTNKELASFIHCLMQKSDRHRRKDFSSVQVFYANNSGEARNILELLSTENYIFIKDEMTSEVTGITLEIDSGAATCREYDKVAMIINESFSYDSKGSLIATRENANGSVVRNLYHGLSRAKKGVALLVLDNEPVFESILEILQG